MSMKKYSIHIFLIFIFGCTQAQNGIDQNLKKELDLILTSDQILREYIDSETTEARKIQIQQETGYSQDDLRRNIWGIMLQQDSLNIKKVEKIISIHGYPGKTLVGEPTNEAAWYVIQHSNQISKYFPLIQEAANKNEIPFTRFAMMHDRLLTSQGKEQIYGTQGAMIKIINKETGKEEYFNYIPPIKNPEQVNELRKKVGFTNTVEENARRMGIEYKVYTLEEINQMK